MTGSSGESCAYPDPHRAHDWWPGGDQREPGRHCPGVLRAERPERRAPSAAEPAPPPADEAVGARAPARADQAPTTR